MAKMLFLRERARAFFSESVYRVRRYFLPVVWSVWEVLVVLLSFYVLFFEAPWGPKEFILKGFLATYVLVNVLIRVSVFFTWTVFFLYSSETLFSWVDDLLEDLEQSLI